MPLDFPDNPTLRTSTSFATLALTHGTTIAGLRSDIHDAAAPVVLEVTDPG